MKRLISIILFGCIYTYPYLPPGGGGSYTSFYPQVRGGNFHQSYYPVWYGRYERNYDRYLIRSAYYNVIHQLNSPPINAGYTRP